MRKKGMTENKDAADNLGWLVHLIRRHANKLQTIAADATDVNEIYRLALEIKTDAEMLKRWAINEGERRCSGQ
jgi:hypothetical protein